MAVRTAVTQATSSPSTYVSVLWENITNSDSGGSWDSLPTLRGRTPVDIVFRATGTAGGATLALLGSIDGTNFTPVLDGFGAAVTVTDTAGDDATIKHVAGYFRYWKVTISGGSGSDFDAYMDFFLLNNGE